MRSAGKPSLSNLHNLPYTSELSSNEYFPGQKLVSMIPPALTRLWRARALISMV